MRNKPYPWNERLPWLSDFPEFLAFIEQSYATKPAFVYERGKESVTVTFAQFVADVYNLAAELHLRNWAGKHYALMGPTSYEWILFFFAGILSGGLAVAVDKDLPVKELQLRLTLSDTDILVYVSAYADIANSLHCKDKLCFDETAKLLDHGAAIFSRGGIDRKALVPGVDAPAAIFFTSGTTGRAKGVMLSSRNIIFNVCAASRSFWEEGMNLLILPLHHIYGIAAALLSPLLGGSCSAICPSVKRVKYFLTAYPPDCIFGVPMVVESIAAELWRAAAKQKKTKLLKTMLAISNGLQKIGIDASSILLASVRKNFGGRLQSIGCGGAELDVKYYSLFRGLGVSLVNGYGITECAPMIAMNRNRHWRDGSVGLPLCGVEVRIAARNQNTNDAGRALPVGEIQVRGKNVFPGYYKDEAATRAAFTEDGWFKTGDLGRLDEDGFLYITGRKKNLMILSNGENVSPEWLEARLLHIAYVREALVYSEGGRITAEFYLDPEANADVYGQLESDVGAINRTVPLYAQIGRIKVRKEEFAKTAIGKILRMSFSNE